MSDDYLDADRVVAHVDDLMQWMSISPPENPALLRARIAADQGAAEAKDLAAAPLSQIARELQRTQLRLLRELNHFVDDGHAQADYLAYLEGRRAALRVQYYVAVLRGREIERAETAAVLAQQGPDPLPMMGA